MAHLRLICACCLQAEKERFAKLDASVSGRNAQTVHRDRATGKRMTEEEMSTQQKEKEKPKSEAPAWGGGIAQVSDEIHKDAAC